MDTYLIERLLQRIKDLLKEKGMTYVELARRMGVSEVTIKRMLNQQDISMTRVIEISKILDVPLADELAALEAESVKAHTFTAKQDEYFAAFPHLMAYFQHLTLLKKTPTQLAAEFGLSGACTHQYLSALESLGLLRQLPSGAVKILVEPPMGFGADSTVVKQQIAQSLAFTNECLFGKKPVSEEVYLLVKPLKINKALTKQFVKEYYELLQSYAKISERNFESDDELCVASFALHPADIKGQNTIIALEPDAFKVAKKPRSGKKLV